VPFEMQTRAERLTRGRKALEGLRRRFERRGGPWWRGVAGTHARDIDHTTPIPSCNGPCEEPHDASRGVDTARTRLVGFQAREELVPSRDQMCEDCGLQGIPRGSKPLPHTGR